MIRIQTLRIRPMTNSYSPNLKYSGKKDTKKSIKKSYFQSKIFSHAIVYKTQWRLLLRLSILSLKNSRPSLSTQSWRVSPSPPPCHGWMLSVGPSARSSRCPRMVVPNTHSPLSWPLSSRSWSTCWSPVSPLVFPSLRSPSTRYPVKFSFSWKKLVIYPGR